VLCPHNIVYPWYKNGVNACIYNSAHNNAPGLPDGIQRSLQPTESALLEFIIYSDDFHILPSLSVQRDSLVIPVVSVCDRNAFRLIGYQGLVSQ
jgi:hypothetical protein